MSTYCVPMIQGEVRRYLRDNNSIRVSRSLKDLAYKTLKTKDEWIIEKGVEQSGKSNESKESEETQENAELSKRQNHIQKQEATKTSSFNWRWACIAVIALALVLYWKRMPILDWIRKILAGIRKIL